MTSRILAGIIAGAMVAAAAGPTIYGSAYNGGGSGASTLYTISPTTGAATSVGPIGFTFVGAIAFDSTGTLYGIGTSAAGTWVVALELDLRTLEDTLWTQA